MGCTMTVAGPLSMAFFSQLDCIGEARQLHHCRLHVTLAVRCCDLEPWTDSRANAHYVPRELFGEWLLALFCLHLRTRMAHPRTRSHHLHRNNCQLQQQSVFMSKNQKSPRQLVWGSADELR